MTSFDNLRDVRFTSLNLFPWDIGRLPLTFCSVRFCLDLKTKIARLTWEIKGKYKADNPTLKKYNLWLNEKLAIIDDPDKNLGNQCGKKSL